MIAATTGFFDGVHLGHKKVIEKLCAVAKEKGLKSEVITFWPHPRSVLQQEAFNLRLLTTLEEKKMLFKKLGVNRVKVLEFSKQFSQLSTEEFVKDYLVKKLGVSILVIGYDHRIGHNPKQKQEDMIAICKAQGLDVIRVEENVIGGEIVSSTKIRKELENGEIEGANKFLGYNYFLDGVVVKGNGLGRTIGFPTANVKLYAPLKLVPQDGVYAVKVHINGNEKVAFKGICNIGYRPTVGSNNAKTIEVHILNFDEDIYGLDIKVEFVHRMRSEKKFAGLKELKVQLEKDKECAEQLLHLS